jgi:hypothetical protein
MSFTERQKLQLKAFARSPLDIRFGMANPELDMAIEQIYLENSKAFLDKKDLKDRVFYHKPATLKEGEYLAYHHEFIRERGF